MSDRVLETEATQTYLDAFTSDIQQIAGSIGELAARLRIQESIEPLNEEERAQLNRLLSVLGVEIENVQRDLGFEKERQPLLSVYPVQPEIAHSNGNGHANGNGKLASPEVTSPAPLPVGKEELSVLADEAPALVETSPGGQPEQVAEVKQEIPLEVKSDIEITFTPKQQLVVDFLLANVGKKLAPGEIKLAIPDESTDSAKSQIFRNVWKKMEQDPRFSSRMHKEGDTSIRRYWIDPEDGLSGESQPQEDAPAAESQVQSPEVPKPKEATRAEKLLEKVDYEPRARTDEERAILKYLVEHEGKPVDIGSLFNGIGGTPAAGGNRLRVVRELLGRLEGTPLGRSLQYDAKKTQLTFDGTELVGTAKLALEEAVQPEKPEGLAVTDWGLSLDLDDQKNLSVRLKNKPLKGMSSVSKKTIALLALQPGSISYPELRNLLIDKKVIGEGDGQSVDTIIRQIDDYLQDQGLSGSLKDEIIGAGTDEAVRKIELRGKVAVPEEATRDFLALPFSQ